MGQNAHFHIYRYCFVRLNHSLIHGTLFHIGFIFVDLIVITIGVIIIILIVCYFDDLLFFPSSVQTFLAILALGNHHLYVHRNEQIERCSLVCHNSKMEQLCNQTLTRSLVISC